MPTDHTGELEEMLDGISYLVTSARTAGAEKPRELRVIVKRMRQLVNDADSLALTIEVERSKERE